MPDISSGKQTATTYPPQRLYEQWVNQAEKQDLSLSQYLIRMVEAGRKDISMDNASSESIRELLQKQANLKKEIERQRERVQDLEHQLQRTSQSDIISFLDENPGSATPEIIQHVVNTAPGRVASHLDALEGDAIEQRDDGYHVIEPED